LSDIRVEFVVAAGRNGVIGRENDLPWRLSSDLKRFRKLTLGKPVLMGRKTFESIGKPLDGRANVVVTRDAGFSEESVEVADSPMQGLTLARAAAARMDADAVMVIGGAEIYRQLRDEADIIHLTRVDLAPEGDAYFEQPDPAQWRMTQQEHVEAGLRDDADYTVETYMRVG
jgi:dihydrofolate reductase